MSIRLAAAVAALSLAAGAAGAQQVRLMTGPQGGSWYPLGGAIQNIIENRIDGASVQVLPGAGIANVKAVQEGKAQMGFANSVSTVDGVKGAPPFDAAADNVCNVATLYPQYFQVVALADSGIETPADMAGKDAAIQPVGNTGEAITEHMLRAHGLGYDALGRVNRGSYTDSVGLLKDGNAEFFTLGTTIPAGAIMDLASARDIRMVPIDDEGLAAMQEINAGYQRGTIPAGTYPGQDEDTPTIVYATHLIAACDLDEQLVHDVAAALAESVGDLASIASAVKGVTPEDMARDLGVPMHEGAARYYREQGVM
jgi:TRAP transporter TAXI family solute receptor